MPDLIDNTDITWSESSNNLTGRPERLNDGTNVVSASQARSHIDSTSNPHSVTASQVSLGNVVNTEQVVQVTHGTTTTTARPTATVVFWRGGLPPENAQDGDMWDDLYSGANGLGGAGVWLRRSGRWLRTSELYANGLVTDDLEALYTMEHERRNLLRYSEAFDNSAWIKSQLTVTTGFVDPNGNTNAQKLTSTGSDPYPYQAITGLSADTNYTASFWIKALGTTVGKTAVLRIRDNGAFGGSSDQTSSFSLPREWERITFTVTTTAAGDVQFRIDAPDSGVVSGDEVLIYGAQFNQGATAIDYTPTTNKQALYDYSNNGRHATRGSVGSAFICPVGEKHLSLPGSGSNYAETPDSASNSITGDIDLRAEFAAADWTPSAEQTFLGKLGTSPSRGPRFTLTTGGNLSLLWSTTGSDTPSETSTAAVAFSNNERAWVRATLDVDNGAGAYEVKFYTSTDGASWTQLGSTITGGSTTSIFDNAQPWSVGGYATGGGPALLFDGLAYTAQVYDGIDGTLVADFNPNRDAHGDVTRFTSSTTGEVWTINQASASDTNDPTWTGEGADFDGTDDTAATPASLPALFSGTQGITLGAVAEVVDAATRTIIGGQTEVIFRLNFGKPEFILNSFSTNDRATASSALSVGVYHIAGRYASGGDISVIEGTTELDSATPSGSYTEPTELTFGELTSSAYLEGTLPLAWVYSRGLTDAEISQNYRAAQKLLADRGMSI